MLLCSCSQGAPIGGWCWNTASSGLLPSCLLGVICFESLKGEASCFLGLLVMVPDPLRATLIRSFEMGRLSGYCCRIL